MRHDDLPTRVKELQRLLIKTQSLVDSERQRTALAEERSINAEQRASVAEQRSVELAATIEKQQQQLEQSEQKILELLAALRGKQRERVDPAQLMLFDVGELKSFIDEHPGDGDQDEEIPASRRRRKRSHGVFPDDLPRVEIEYTLPEDELMMALNGRF